MVNIKYVDAMYVRALTKANIDARDNGLDWEAVSPKAQSHLDYILRRLVHEVNHTVFPNEHNQRYTVHFYLGDVDRETFSEIARVLGNRGFYVRLDSLEEETKTMAPCAQFTIGW